MRCNPQHFYLLHTEKYFSSKKIFIAVFIFILNLNLSAQTYQMYIANAAKADNYNYEFDVYIRSTGEDFQLTSYQCAFTFNAGNSLGTLTFTYISGSSLIKNIPAPGIGIKQNDGVKELTFASMPGTDTISSKQKKIGRFRLRNSVAYSSAQLQLNWNFQGNVSTIITAGGFKNITSSSSHFTSPPGDITAPMLSKVSLLSTTSLVLTFSEKINAADAANKANYVISPGITISSAVLSSDGLNVTLITSEHTPGLLYSVTVNNIKDLAGNGISSTAKSLQYSPEDNSLKLNARIFLQGPYKGNKSMGSTLNILKFLPDKHDYNRWPFYYYGTETVTSIPAGVVDWVLIELRSDTAPSTKVTRRTAFVKTDGYLVDFDGISKVKLSGISAGSYYLVVYHRIHLGIMSSVKVNISSNSPLYDFTTASGKAYGTSPQADLGDGSFGLYSGDGNGNQTVNNVDIDGIWQPELGKTGYLKGDFDMNGGVNITDKNAKWQVNSGKVSRIPTK